MDTIKIEAHRIALSPTQIDSIVDKLVHLRKITGTSIMALADLPTLKSELFNLANRGQVISCYKGWTLAGIIVFDVCKQWWTNKYVVYEMLVLCLDDTLHGFGRYAMEQLQFIAEYYHCSAIVGGCLFNKQSKMVTNTYKKFGFEVAPSFYKVLE